LDGLESTAGWAADVVNVPPLDTAGLRREWEMFRRSVARIPTPNLPSAERVRAQWEQLKAEAASQGQTVFQLSSMMAVAAISRTPDTLMRLARAANRAVWRTGQSFGAKVFEHYGEVLREIQKEGYAAYWAAEFRPYLLAAAAQFSPKHRSLTAKLLR